MYIIKQIANGIISKPQGLPDTKATPEKLANIVVYAGVVAAVISVVVIVIAGVQFVISSGEPGKVTKARTAILYAVVGLIVSLSATTIASFVARSVG